MKKFLHIFVFAIFSLLIIPQAVSAEDFNVRVVREYFIDAVDKVSVVETHILENRSTKSWISEGNTEYFFVSVTSGNTQALDQTLGSVLLKVNGVGIAYSTDKKEDYAILSAKLPSAIKPGGTMTFVISYDNYGLVEKKGALTDFYAPGFKEDSTDASGEKTTSYSYDTYVNVAKTLPSINFATPDPNETGETDKYTRYYFNYDTLLDKYIWIQIGRKQYYKFTITQTANATEDRDTGYKNEYRLIVPRVIDEPQIYQTVYFSKIDPLPKYVEEDDNGNLILIFEIPTYQNTTIQIIGFAEVGRNDLAVDASTSGTINDSAVWSMGDYLKSAIYWEVDNAQIKAKTKEVVGAEKNIFVISKDLYDFVISEIDYSKVKRFGLNERQGALTTLNGGAAVCMEYSDLYLTMSRAAGVPTRAVFGYGYDSKIQNDAQEAHQWVEVYMPGLEKWVSIDVTWGESGMKMAEGNLNHFFTHVASENPNTPSLVERKSYGTESELSTPVYSIEAVEQITDVGGLKTQEMLLSEYEKPPTPTNAVSAILDKLNIFKSVNVSTIMIAAGAVLMIVSAVGIVRMLKQEQE